MGSYIFERSGEDANSTGPALVADVERALGELDWVEDFSVRADDGDGGVVLADVHFDPDWPDTANADLVAEVFQRYGIRTLDRGAAGGKVSATDPLHASAEVDDGGIDLFVFDEK
jgi:hypothetical protein